MKKCEACDKPVGVHMGDVCTWCVVKWAEHHYGSISLTDWAHKQKAEKALEEALND